MIKTTQHQYAEPTAEHQQLEEQLRELQAADRAEAERQATIARLLQQKQEMDQAHQLALIEAEINELKPKYEAARKGVLDRRELLLRDLRKVLAEYQSEVGDKVAPLDRMAMRLAILGCPRKSMDDVFASPQAWIASSVALGTL